MRRTRSGTVAIFFLLLMLQGAPALSQADEKNACDPNKDQSRIKIGADSLTIDDKAFILTSAVWPYSTIFVCWENPTDADASGRSWVKEAVTATWQNNSGLSFKGWVKCLPDTWGIRIKITDDKDDGPHTKGLGQFVAGPKNAPKSNNMVLNFTFRNWHPACNASREQCIRTIAVHEFGHALGFAHEQNSPEAPGECAKKKQGTSGDVMLTPWDLHSVMNYCNPNQQQVELSACDAYALKTLYPPKP